MSCKDKSVGAQLAIVPGKAVETQAVMLDHVGRAAELYTRCRAWFMTMAYVSIRRREWMDFQTAIFGSEKILTFVNQTFRGQYAPASFYASAWASTIHHLAECVRLSNMSLKEAVKNTGAWEHRWTNWTPSQSNEAGPSKGGLADVPKSVQNELDKLRGEVKMWQSTADKYRKNAESGDQGKRAGKSGSKGGKGAKRSRSRERQHYRDNRPPLQRFRGNGGR